MTFGPDHYVPVLKIKAGEKSALQCISPVLQPQITPLLEIVKRLPEKNVQQHLQTAFNGLAESVRVYPRCFLDAREIAPDGATAADEVFRRAASDRIIFTPVTGISRTADVAAALEHRANGIALRLTRSEFESGGLGARIGGFLDRHALTPEDIDLIIDLGSIDNMVVAGIERLTNDFMAAIPNHQRWQTFTVSACSFPIGMGGVERNSHEFIMREDWITWRDHLYARRANIPRVPTFSDGAIQHPAGVEGIDFRIMPVSASIRYTVANRWLLIKGESTRVINPGEQFPALATRLVYGHLREYFAGTHHCNGCFSIKAAADGAPRLGSPTVWRRIGTTHHISAVMQDLASLPSP